MAENLNTIIPDEEFKKLRALYMSQIEKYDDTPSMQYILCTVGLIGAGKSTVMIPLARKLKIPRISGDEIREMLKKHGYSYKRMREMAYSIVDQLLSEGNSVAIDVNCGSQNSYPRIKKAIDKYTLRAFWVHINPPEKFIVQKLQNHKHTWLFDSGDDAVAAYYGSKKKHGDLAKFSEEFIYTFDTSRQDIDEQIDEAYRIIKRALR